jgi:RHS repeat-associated protein
MGSDPIAARQWTVPDGILQDGATYYMQARTYDPTSDTYSGWSTATSFRVDLRTGKDKSQTYDNLGPVDVDLATGNLATSASSHSSTALGGDLGISLNYNSPLRSRPGLAAEYWKINSGSPDTVPTTTPDMVRVDQAVDFDWGTGNPGLGNQDDYFFARWQGYFTAPVAGTYIFGAKDDNLLRIYVDNTLMFNNTSGCSTVCYSSETITLSAGQTVAFRSEFKENTGNAYAQIWVKNAVDEQQLPVDWLQTGVRPVNSQHGLKGQYFGKFDGTNTFSSSNYLLMERNDPFLSFDWGSTGAPMSDGPDGFLVKWTGSIKVPTSGTYTFGSVADDGTKITLGTGSGTTVYNDWNTHSATEGYGSGYSMTGGSSVPITVEYFDAGGAASFQLKVKVPGSSTGQLVPSDWLSTTAPVLPDGWKLGLDADGDVSYERIQVNSNNAVLTDSSGDTHEYTWTGSGFTPPENEDGQLVRNADGTFTLQDTDGRTYVFSTDGTLTKVTNPTDDRNPAALQYTYGSVSGGPTTLTQITDGVNSNRWAKVYYSGQSQCGSAPSGFDTNAPTNMLCAVETNDGRKTYFYYVSGNLARIAEPGDELTDYGYESVTNGSVTVGYRMSSIRDPLAMDAVGASVRSNDDTVKTQLSYDILGRVASVKQPGATASATRIEHTIEYLPGQKEYVDSGGNTVPGYEGMTKQHMAGATEPNGFSRRVKYDELFRTIEDTDIANLSTTTEWDSAKDLVLSSTDPTGQKKTTIYDDEDRATDEYGPAPSSYYQADRTPSSTYASQVPHTQTGYDESIVGPAVAWYDYTKQTSNPDGVLSGAPKLHATGINSTPGTLSYDFSSPPITASSGAQGIGFSATGKLRLPNGTYTISADTSDGIQVEVDDNLVLDHWVDSSYQTITGTSFTVSDSAPKRIRIDVYRKTGSSGTLNIKIAQTGGFSATTNWSSYLKPDYSLTTSTKFFDSTFGDSTSTTSYGSNPELALLGSTSQDSTGLNLATTSTYETQGGSGSYLRQLTKNLPGNPTGNPSFSYSYYTATETKDNPCTTGTTEAYKQAGLPKLRTEADPDGSGGQASRTTETIYDDAGRAVATRLNSDSWTCTYYDSRGRISESDVPAYNGSDARTVQHDYAVGGDPLETTSWDDQGWIVVWHDLLGRTTKYRDVHDDETTTTYDSLGRMTQRVSPVGTETFVYDSYNRLTDQKLDSTTYATVTYDSYSRVDKVDYPNANSLRSTMGYDSLGRNNSYTYRMGNGTTTIADTITKSQGNLTQYDVVSSGGSSLWYTYGYDHAGRLTSADIGPHSYSYGYGSQNSACGTANNKNDNSGKNGNRTTQTIDGTTTTFCYDYADRLISSSNSLLNGGDYDSHGNMTSVGTGTTPLRLCFDSSDRNSCMTQRNSSGTGIAMYYDRDVAGRVVARYKNTLTNWNATAAGDYWYGYTGDGDGPSFVRSTGWSIVEKTLMLPGGVNLTIKPQLSGNAQKQYNLSNIHGDVLLTADASGANTSNGNGPASAFTYDPFGNVVSGSVLPANTALASYGWEGQHEKLTESEYAVTPIQMGARVYIPLLGRFLQPDPVEGGTSNSYVYVTDPINSDDLSGLCNSAAAWCIIGILKGTQALPTIRIGGLLFTQWLSRRHGSISWVLVANSLRRMRVGGDHCSKSLDLWRACDVHDLGYDLMRWFRSSGPNGSTRYQIDWLFYSDMAATCRAGAWWKRSLCYRTASAYYSAVSYNSRKQGYAAPR